MTGRGRGRGWKHSPEVKAKIVASCRAHFADPAAREQHGAATKAGMADPAVRQRIRDGMKRAAGLADSLQPLRIAWRNATPDMRKRFLDEILSPVFSASAPSSLDRNGGS